jgi:hypothetical protein
MSMGIIRSCGSIIRITVLSLSQFGRTLSLSFRRIFEARRIVARLLIIYRLVASSSHLSTRLALE